MTASLKNVAALCDGVARFGHHPDPTTDFCIEVDVIEGKVYDVSVDFATYDDVAPRVSRAMEFRVGGDAHAIAAKAALRTLATRLETFNH